MHPKFDSMNVRSNSQLTPSLSVNVAVSRVSIRSLRDHSECRSGTIPLSRRRIQRYAGLLLDALNETLPRGGCDMGPNESSKLGFEADVKPLFRDKDRQAMLRAFDLWAYADVVAHADATAQQLGDGTMPCDGRWPEEQVDRFRRWLDEGAAE
jgi:hypothetical protein